MPRPQTKKYAEITDQIVTNLVACSKEVAEARDYKRAADETQIGDRYDPELNAYTRKETIINEEGQEEEILVIIPVPED